MQDLAALELGLYRLLGICANISGSSGEYMKGVKTGPPGPPDSRDTQVEGPVRRAVGRQPLSVGSLVRPGLPTSGWLPALD